MLNNNQLTEDIGEIDIEQPNSLTVKGLSIGRGKELIRDIDIDLQQGEMLLVNGESGIGKTTLIFTILGLLHPIRGHVYWNGT